MDLLKISKKKNLEVVSARELYFGMHEEYSNYSSWIKRHLLNNPFFTENQDYILLVTIKSNTRGNFSQDYGLSFRTAQHLAMMSKSKKAYEYRDYLIECEKIAWNKKNDNWLNERQEGKRVRKDETDTISDFISYAIEQGGSLKGCKMYYSTFTREVYKTIGVDKNRDERDLKDIRKIKQLEQVISTSLKSSMQKELHYKDAYKKAKADFNMVAELSGFNPKLLKY